MATIYEAPASGFPSSWATVEGATVMRRKIDTSEVKFRAGGDAKAKKVKGEDARTPDGRRSGPCG